MKRLLILIIVLLSAVSCMAASKKASRGKPLLVVFGCNTGSKSGEDSGVMASAALDQIKSLDRFRVVANGLSLPPVARAIAEKRITNELLSRLSDPGIASQIAAIAGADYVLGVSTSVVPVTSSNGKPEGNSASVTMDLTKVTGEHWSHRGDSVIANIVGPGSDKKVFLAGSTAASMALNGLMIEVFPELGNVERVGQPLIPAADLKDTHESTPASPANISVEPKAEQGRDVYAEYKARMASVEDELAKGNRENAIVELKRAIDLDPMIVESRIRLAKLYLEVGMDDAALDEYARIALLQNVKPGNGGGGSGKPALPNSASGTEVADTHKALAELYKSRNDFVQAAKEYQEVVRCKPDDLDSKIILGDMYWNQGMVAEAESEYRSAADQSPLSSAPHEKLRSLYLARKNFPRAIEELQKSMASSKNPGTDMGTARVIETEFNEIVNKLDSGESDFNRGVLPREDYYQECRELGSRIEALDKFVSALQTNGSSKRTFSHAALAVSLLAQSNGYTLSFLETEQIHYLQQSDLLRSEARTELQQFAGRE